VRARRASIEEVQQATEEGRPALTTINGKNVNELWARGLHTLKTFGIESDSRAGRVLVMQTPVTSVYRNPCERVLMDPLRDANPFFHLMESLWMLAGRVMTPNS
jgi:hypothetical protein